VATSQLLAVFPILNFLRIASSLPQLCVPSNYIQLCKSFVAFFTCKKRKVSSQDVFLMLDM